MTANTATDKQVALIQKLVAERDLSLEWTSEMDSDGPAARSTAARASLEVSREAWKAGKFTSKVASTTIEFLLASPYKTEAPAEAQGPQVTDGFYELDGQIIKVQVAKNGSGRLYAKVRTEHGWEYTPGLVAKLTPADKLTEELAAQWGHLYGECCLCGRDLTDEESIARGIGPVCAGKYL